MKLVESPFDLTTTYEEFEIFILREKIDYLLMKKKSFNADFNYNFSKQYNYELLFENKRYEIYRVYIFEFIQLNN